MRDYFKFEHINKKTSMLGMKTRMNLNTWTVEAIIRMCRA